MEAVSPTVEGGRLVKWHKRAGDAVKTGQSLAGVETHTAVMELVARADGVLRQVAVTEGQTVPVGNVVAVIAAPGQSPDVPAATSPRPAPTPAVGSGERGAVLVAAAPRPTPTAPADATRVKASPLARRIARAAGVDLQLVTGSGPGGRVVRKDLERTAATGTSASPPSAAQRMEPLPAPRPPSAAAAEAVAPYQDG